MENSGDLEKAFSDIDKLASIPNYIRDSALDVIKTFEAFDLKRTDRTKLKSGADLIRNISNESLSKEYSIIYSQTCVLAVSALSAHLEKIFRESINSNWKKINYKEAPDLKFSLKELADLDFEMINFIGDLVISKDKGINFQDLQSIVRTFKDYLGIDIELEEGTKYDIIFYQQCRHVLVHNSGKVNAEFLKKIASTNRNDYKNGENIKLVEKDWTHIKESFLILYKIILAKIDPSSSSA